MKVKIIGAGLAGCEAAFQAAKMGASVELIEMKPVAFSPAHKNSGFAEVICSNSFKSEDLATASGLLKEELKLLDCELLKIAESVRVPAGGALAVDRELFSKKVTDKLSSLPNITVIHKIEDSIIINDDEALIIATGPLTHPNLLEAIKDICGGFLNFFDAVAPIVTAESIDTSKTFTAGRYGKGDDYTNCPMSKDEYETFWHALVTAETVQLKDFENNVFEGCMPVEVMAKRGIDTLRFGPFRPVGLRTPTGEKPYAVLQLRKENAYGTIYNLVGMQTNLTFKEQKRVFSLIPALKNAEFVRYGVMHKNTFINAPLVLNKHFQCKNRPNVFFAGQLTGVEGYVESIASGLIAGKNSVYFLRSKPLTDFQNITMIGAIASYISTPNVDFQPMNANFGILPPLEERIKDKHEKKLAYSKRSLAALSKIIKGE